MNKNALKTAIDMQVSDLRTKEDAKDLLDAWEKTLEYVKGEIQGKLPTLLSQKQEIPAQK